LARFWECGIVLCVPLVNDNGVGWHNGKELWEEFSFLRWGFFTKKVVKCLLNVVDMSFCTIFYGVGTIVQSIL
jgi:hypothetical protein